MQVGAKRAKPMGSSRWMVSMMDGLLSLFGLFSGIRRKAMNVNATAPAGKLI